MAAYRELSPAARAGKLFEFATALSTYAGVLRRAGRMDEALAAGVEAIAVGRELLGPDRGRGSRLLASTLRDQAKRLSELSGRNKARNRRIRALSDESAGLAAE